MSIDFATVHFVSPPPFHEVIRRNPNKLKKAQRHLSYLNEKLRHATGSSRVHLHTLIAETKTRCKLLQQAAAKTQYVYHRKKDNFQGDTIFPLNVLKDKSDFSKIYTDAASKYQGREELLEFVIPTLNCHWNDVIFLSPLHPYYHYAAYQKIGFMPIPSGQYFKIPIERLKDLRTTVYFNSPKHQVYPREDPWRYCSLDCLAYREMHALPYSTMKHFREHFDPQNPQKFPPYNWMGVPHILCQDPISITDAVSIIDWSQPI